MTDIVLIGAGHNGLVCAFYLARAGCRVTVVERASVVGGAAVTEEFHPGFRNSAASYTVSLLHPQIIADLELHARGLTILERRVQNFLPLPDARSLALGEGRTQREVAKFSSRDAAQLPEYGRRLEAVVEVVRALALETPPSLAETTLQTALPDLFKTASLGRRLAGLSATGRRDLLALFAQSAGDWLDGWFESDPIKAALGFDGVVGAFASPYTPGTAYVLLHHVFGEVNGKRGQWGHAKGGMGAITQAMARACAAVGVSIRTEAPVREVILEKGRAAGVVLESGETLRAAAVASSVHPKILFDRLLPAGVLSADVEERMRRYRSGSATFRMNVALSELPRLTAAPEPGDHLTAGIIIAPSLGYMDAAYMDARRLGWSRAPIVEMVIPSTLDDSLAPPGAHVASLFCQHAAPSLPDGRSWDEARNEVADLMIAAVDAHAPGFAASVLGRQIYSPLDLERRFGLVAGDIFHGQLTLDQLFAARPILGYGAYRAPAPGLYLCGSGAHPGGGVTGLPGRNAAREILRDLRHGRGLPGQGSP